MKEYCGHCNTNTNHIVVKSEKKGSTPDANFDWSEEYAIIKCMGCDSLQFRTTYSDETMISWNHEEQEEFYYDIVKYFPKNIVGYKALENSYNIPDKIRVVYNESVEALKNDCYLLCAVGLRAVIEAICIDQGITGRNLEIKINNLVRSKLITEKDSGRLHSIRFLGNDSVHDMEVPKESKIRIALNIIEHLINNLYLIDIDANEHLDTIINNYDDFKNLLRSKFISINSVTELSIKEILGKKYRRIESTYIPNFTQQLIDEINAGTFQYLKIGAVKPSSIETSDVQHFIIESPF
ncbi:DUF4145 domain-containing protein [Pedobacter ureilyticus]|uniref:DUF4145 domain-containing protein n=1 Tax=Pedobacter ureilyticus TaxID=1393051 RepID=A0ABW9J9R5_9SPHI|nr:DUF4145 domain-containing protein [Pedobacter helvus]